MRWSRSHSTGMCIQRLSAAARPGLPSAIFFIRSKYSSGKMCGKISSLRSIMLFPGLPRSARRLEDASAGVSEVDAALAMGHEHAVRSEEVQAEKHVPRCGADAC